MILKYRTYFKAIPPSRIKLSIPGWAGDNLEHGDGAKPQPWHCTPFVDGSTYGLELIYPFQAECVVSCRNGRITFNGDFSNEAPWTQNGEIAKPPFSAFAPGHYGFTSSLDLEPQEGFTVRLEPHPRFFTDTTGTVPIMVPGHINRWWSRIFFVVFKSPAEGQDHIFRYGEPYGQILIVPEKPEYDLVEMTEEEIKIRQSRDQRIAHFAHELSRHEWKDFVGNTFDDKYKRLKSAYAKNGYQGVDGLIEQAVASSKPKKKKPFKGKLIKR